MIGSVSHSDTSSSRHSSPACWRFAERDLLQRLQREPVARQAVVPREPLLHLDKPQAGAQRALRSLVADDPVEALQRLGRVREPVAVVAVVDVVAAEQPRNRTRRENPRRDGGGVVLPRTRGARAVQDRDPGEREESLPRGRVAAGRFLVGDVGDRAVHRVIGAALAVGRDAVHPRDPLDVPLDAVVLGHALRPVGEQEVVQVAEVASVHVAEREALALGPWERQAGDLGEHGPVLGLVQGPGALLDPGVRLDVHGHLGRIHRLHLTVDDVGVRISRGERQLEGGEPPRARHGVRPRQSPGPADQHEWNPVQRAALRVELAGDAQVGLVEALRPVPREVRVAEHHSASVRRRLGAEAVCVRAQRRLERVELRAPERAALALQRGACLAPRQWRGARDPLDRHPGAGEAAQLMEAAVDVDRPDGPHPARPLAARVGYAVDAGTAQVHVVAVDVAPDQLLHPRHWALGRWRGHQVLDDAGPVDALVEEVGLEVVVDAAVAREGPRAVGPEVARALSGHRDVGVGDRADVVLRERVREPEAEPPEAVGRDVGDAIGRAPDRRSEALRLALPCRAGLDSIPARVRDRLLRSGQHQRHRRQHGDDGRAGLPLGTPCRGTATLTRGIDPGDGSRFI